MKPRKKKLRLSAETLRRLQADVLREVAGGKPTVIPKTELSCDFISCVVNSCEVCGPV